MEDLEVKRLKSLEEENARLKKLLAETDPDPKSCSIQKQNSGMINTP